MKKVLFVCTGNTCRSCMAEAIFNNLVQNDNQLNGKVISSSAGIHAYSGESASSNSIEVLRKKWGIDLANHKSRLINPQIIEDADIILTMTNKHKKIIISDFEEYKNKVFTLPEFTSDNPQGSTNDVQDPYGETLEEYERCAEKIFDKVKILIKKLTV